MARQRRLESTEPGRATAQGVHEALEESSGLTGQAASRINSRKGVGEGRYCVVASTVTLLCLCSTALPWQSLRVYARLLHSQIHRRHCGYERRSPLRLPTSPSRQALLEDLLSRPSVARPLCQDTCITYSISTCETLTQSSPLIDDPSASISLAPFSPLSPVSRSLTPLCAFKNKAHKTINSPKSAHPTRPHSPDRKSVV